MDDDPGSTLDPKALPSADRVVRRLVPVVVYALFVLVASVTTTPSGTLAPLGPFGVVGVDKWLHVGAYAGLSAGIGYALRAARLRSLVVAALFAIVFGLGIEVAQATLPARAFTVADALANTLGASVGATFRWLWLRVARV